MNETTNIFISYSRESDAHSERVLRLADRLRNEGLDCNFDQYVDAPSEGWPLWMERQISDSTYVLIICTEAYAKKARGNSEPGKGNGIRFESLLTYQEILEAASMNNKFIPVLFSREDIPFILKPLKSFQHYVIDLDIDFDDGYEDLYRRLTNQPKILKPPVGDLEMLQIGVNLPNKQKESEARSYDSIGKSLDCDNQLSADVFENNMCESAYQEIALKINQSFEDFKQKDQERLLAAIRELLCIQEDLRITKIKPGCVLLTISVPKEKAQKLLDLVKSGKLTEYDVINAELKDSSIQTDYDELENVVVEDTVATANKAEESHFQHLGVPVGIEVSRNRSGRAKFEVGDKVVYPHQGAGQIIKKEQRDVGGTKREYLTIQILHDDMTVMVPRDSADRVLRKVINGKEVDEVIAILRQDETKMPKNWNQRFKNNRERLKKDDIFELAEVVRGLSLREQEKGLSTREKQMLNRAKKILASELMYARGLAEDEADNFLDGVLREVKSTIFNRNMDDE